MHFVMKAYHDGKPWIVLEPLAENLTILDKGILGFDLAPGTTGEEAEELARLLNERVTTIGYTIIPGWGKS